MAKKQKLPSVKKNFVYSTAYQILSLITPFITSPYLSRVLGAEKIGIQSYTASLMTYFTLFAALGTNSYGTREIARNRDNKAARSKLFWEIELMTVFTSGISMIAWLILVLVSHKYKIYMMVMSLNIITTMMTIDWFFQGLEQFRAIIIRNMVFKVLGIILMLLFVKKPEDLLIFIIIRCSTDLLSILTLWTYLPGLIERVKIKSLKIKEHFKQTLIYFVPTIATTIYSVLDRTLIGLITQDTTYNGYYLQAEKIVGMARGVAYQSLNSVIGARASYLFASNKTDEVKSRMKSALNYIYFMGFGCVFGIIGVAKNFVPVFFGPGYDYVVPLLYVLAPLTVIIGTSSTLGGQYYTPSGRRVQSTRYLLYGCGANVILNLLLIPHFKAVGAAIASVCAEGIITFLYVHNSEGFCNFILLLKIAAKKIIAGVLMIAFLLTFGNFSPYSQIVILLAQIVIGVLIYFAALYIMRDEWLIKKTLYMIDKAKRIIFKKNKDISINND